MGEMKNLIRNLLQAANTKHQQREQTYAVNRLRMQFRNCVVHAVQVQFEQPVEAAQRRVTDATWSSSENCFTVRIFAGMVQGADGPVEALRLSRAETRDAFTVAVSGEVGDGWDITFVKAPASKTVWLVHATPRG